MGPEGRDLQNQPVSGDVRQLVEHRQRVTQMMQHIEAEADVESAVKAQPVQIPRNVFDRVSTDLGEHSRLPDPLGIDLDSDGGASMPPHRLDAEGAEVRTDIQHGLSCKIALERDLEHSFSVVACGREAEGKIDLLIFQL